MKYKKIMCFLAVVLLAYSMLLLTSCNKHEKLSDALSNDSIYTLIYEVQNSYDNISAYSDEDNLYINGDDLIGYVYENEFTTAVRNSSSISINNEKITVDLFYDVNDNLLTARTDEVNLGILSTNNDTVILEDYNSNQVYKINIHKKVAEPLLPTTAFGFSYDEYASLSDKYNTIFWFENPTVNKSFTKLAYWSNKSIINGNPYFEGGIWVMDLMSGTEYKLNLPVNSANIMSNQINWIDDETLLFVTHEEEQMSFYKHNLVNNNTEKITALPPTFVHIADNIMLYSEKDTIVIWNLTTLQNQRIPTSSTISIERIYRNNNKIAFTNRQDNSTIIVNTSSGKLDVYDSEFDDAILRVGGWNSDGELILNVFDVESANIKEIYKINEVKKNEID